MEPQSHSSVFGLNRASGEYTSSADRQELRGTNEYRPPKRPATLQGPSTGHKVVQRYPNRKSKSLTSGSDLPAAPEHTKGDDVWTFYRSVLAEYTSIEKVLSRLVQTDCRQYKLENPLEFAPQTTNTSSKYGKSRNPSPTSTPSNDSFPVDRLLWPNDGVIVLNGIGLSIQHLQHKLKSSLETSVERDTSLKSRRWMRND